MLIVSPYALSDKAPIFQPPSHSDSGNSNDVLDLGLILSWLHVPLLLTTAVAEGSSRQPTQDRAIMILPDL